MNLIGKQVVPEDLSALVDGEVDAGSAAALSEVWRRDAELRARWHRYQLIGDVMRSAELAGTGRDAAFLANLRGRLAQEPVVLAPAVTASSAPDAVEVPAVAAAGGASVGNGNGNGDRTGLFDVFGSQGSRRSRAALRRWSPPAALAAGFLVVAIGSLSLPRPPVPAGAAIAEAVPQPTSPVTVSGTALTVAASGSGAPAAGPAGVPVGVQTAAADQPERATGVMIRDARLDGYLAAHKQFGGSSALGLPSGFLRNATHQGAAVPGEQ